jgi:hypothetical protein
LGEQEESARYGHHQNHANEGYKNFLNRLLIPLKTFLPSSFNALDFGCGPGPVLAEMLKEVGASASLYDPQFFPEESVLNNSYEVVTCTEVVEHFKRPKKSWDILVGRVKTNGLLAVMTQLIEDHTDYQKWWYKNDPTHVVFYSRETMHFLAEKYGLEILYNDDQSVVIFRKI